MGYSRAQKANTHECIIKLASKRFREEGPAGIGIAELMKEAGDTPAAASELARSSPAKFEPTLSWSRL